MPNSSTLLVIEDDPDIREGVADVLRDEGFSVTTFKQGDEALIWLEAGNTVDGIFLDLSLPGMDGLEFRRRQLRAPAIASIPVIVVTASPHREEEANALNVAAFVRKPFDLVALLGTLQQVLQAGMGSSDGPHPRTLPEEEIGFRVPA